MNRILCATLLAGMAASAVMSAQAPTTTSTQVTTMRAAPAPPTGFRAEYLAEVDDVGKKLVDLAQAMPAEKYSWRPAPDVRSVGEVYVHIVAGNSTLPSFLGAPRLEGVSRDSEKTVTDKAKIVELLKKSIENVKAAAGNVTDADLSKKVKTFGDREMTERQVLFRILNHMHEHLGQSIAYARSNGVTPPWSD
ncbi:MAG TPA: DinB family protein [Thermoanaerobaculia bacterium]